MLVRFSNVDGCATCTQTIDFNMLRAIGMLKETSDASSYFVRLSFVNGDTYLAKQNMTLQEAIAYRSRLEEFWGGGSSLSLIAM